MKIDFMDIDKLIEHEEVIHDHLHCLCDEIVKNKWIRPILVDKDNFIILDGHHRYNALKKLGIKKVPVALVDYFDDNFIELKAWRVGENYIKQDVVNMAKSGIKFIPKTTRHIIKKDLSLPVVQL